MRFLRTHYFKKPTANDYKLLLLIKSAGVQSLRLHDAFTGFYSLTRSTAARTAAQTYSSPQLLMGQIFLCLFNFTAVKSIIIYIYIYIFEKKKS